MTLSQAIVALVERDPTDTTCGLPAEIAGERRLLRQAEADSSTGSGTLRSMGAQSKERWSASSQRAVRASAPTAVGDLLAGVLSDLELSPAADALRVLQVWDQVLGPGLSPHCRAVAVRRGTLVAEVSDSAWMQRLQFEKPRILGRLRELLGEGAPGELRFRISAPPP